MRNKFLLIVFNQIRFDSRKYGNAAVTTESKFMWAIVNTQVQQTLPFKISTTQLILQDEFVNLDSLTELEDASLFKFDLQPLKSYEKDYTTLVDITVEMNLD